MCNPVTTLHLYREFGHVSQQLYWVCLFCLLTLVISSKEISGTVGHVEILHCQENVKSCIHVSVFLKQGQRMHQWSRTSVHIMGMNSNFFLKKQMCSISNKVKFFAAVLSSIHTFLSCSAHKVSPS